MKPLHKLLFFALLVLFFIDASAQKDKVKKEKKTDSKTANTWLWEISGNGLAAPSYLFGTMHAMCAEDFKMGDSLVAKLGKSKQLVVEVADADNPMNIFVVMQKMAMKGTTLKKLYTEAEYAEIKKFFTDTIGVELDQLNSFCPFFAVIATMPAQMGCDEVKVYESELTQMARRENKEVKELETIEFQASLFDTIPYAIQAKELLRLVREWNKEKQLLKELSRIYKNKEFDRSLVLARSNFGALTEYWDIFVKNRNEAWVNKIKMLVMEKPTMIAVGAAHLGGDYGLISLLRKMGYTVTPVME